MVRSVAFVGLQSPGVKSLIIIIHERTYYLLLVVVGLACVKLFGEGCHLIYSAALSLLDSVQHVLI